MNYLRLRRFRPGLALLESRCLLSGLVPNGIWLGQDGRDLAGGPQPLVGNGIQDMHISVTNLPAGRTIETVDVEGYGGGSWLENIGNYSKYNAALVQTSGSTSADLYLDPYQVETGRRFDITLKFDDGSSSAFWLNGGTANPNLRIPGDAISGTWIGQDGKDFTSVGPAVGPDGYQDVHLSLNHLYAGTPISSATIIASPSGAGWAWGTNPGLLSNAEVFVNEVDLTKADIYLSPNADLFGQTLTITVIYADGKQDQATVIGGVSNASLAAPAVAPISVNWGTISAQWSGQDGLNLVGPGDAHLSVSGIPSGRTVVSAALNDQVGSVWVYLKPDSGATTAEPVALQLEYRASNDPTKADITFPPNRNETGATLTLRLVLDDGTMLAARVTAGSTDPGLRVADIASSSVVAFPGDDLNDLANRYGSVRLAPGIYPLSQPLILNHPVTIVGAPGALLLFSQPSSQNAWTTAIKVNASHTTLSGFAVRFAGPVRWLDGISYGPAVIGVPDNFDQNNGDPKVDLVFSNLDLQAPPASTFWEEAPHLFRLNNAESGTISGNLLKGGTTEFFGGPWIIAGNTYVGTMPNTYSYGVFSGHYTHDLVLANNKASNAGPSGKTWRFLVLTQEGINLIVRNNDVVGIGPMDTDTVPNPNAPEVILTEAYQVHYEGKVASVSSDGQVVQIPAVLSGQVRSGDVISILDGSQAGQWRLIAQVINATTFLLDKPITSDSFDVSISTGFVNNVFDGNTVDSRGSSVADNLVLAGNQFNAVVTNNTLIGGDRGFRISSFPTESIYYWGWTHAPFLGALIQGNVIEDTLRGGYLDVERSVYTKSSTGRVYFTGAFLDNQGIWTSSYLASRTAAGVTDPLRFVTIGNSLTADPGEIVVTIAGNSVSGTPAVSGNSTFDVIAGTINGAPTRNQFVVTPSNPRPFVRGVTTSSQVADGEPSTAATKDSITQASPAMDVIGPLSPVLSSSAVDDDKSATVMPTTDAVVDPSPQSTTQSKLATTLVNENRRQALWMAQRQERIRAIVEDRLLRRRLVLSQIEQKALHADRRAFAIKAFGPIARRLLSARSGSSG